LSQGAQKLKLPDVVRQRHEGGQSLEVTHRFEQRFEVQNPLWQLPHELPTSVMGAGEHTALVEVAPPECAPCMQMRLPCDETSQVHPKGQSFATEHDWVQMNEGEMPKHSPAWQSEPCWQPRPRSETEQLAENPPPPVVPVLPQVPGPTLLPPEKPPLEVPNQQALKAAHAPGQAWAPLSQRPLVQCAAFTGPFEQSQNQLGQFELLLQEGPEPLFEPPPPPTPLAPMHRPNRQL
jgi:hypothetical protein